MKKLDTGTTAVAVTLVGIAGGMTTWFMGVVVFASFIAGIAFTAISAYIVAQAC